MWKKNVLIRGIFCMMHSFRFFSKTQNFGVYQKRFTGRNFEERALQISNFVPSQFLVVYISNI